MSFFVRKLTTAVIVTAIIAAGFPSTGAFAQAQLASVGAVAPVDPITMISSTVKAFPNGGEPLKQAIADLIVKHPNLASNLASYLKNDPSLTPAQKQAIVAGLADALNRLGVVAQAAGGVDPLLIAFLAAGGALAGWAIYKATQKDDTVSPN